MRCWAVALTGVASAGCGRVAFDALPPDARTMASSDGPLLGTDAVTPGFVDTFDRADSATLGNGWIEKTPNTFSIQGNHVTRGVSGDWTVNMVYRPPAENLLDVEISLEVTINDVGTPDWPQIFVRGVPANVTAYWLWIELGPTTTARPIDIARQGAGEASWVALDQKMVPPALVGDRYRLRLRATGTVPVDLQAHYEIFDGSGWTDVVTLQATDASSFAIVTPETWGLDGHTGTATGPYTYDNFTATAL